MIDKYPSHQYDLDLSFQDSANCQGADPDIFFPEYDDLQKIRQAKAIWGECVVKEECLNYALVFPEQHGIFGGLSARERNLLARRTR